MNFSNEHAHFTGTIEPGMADIIMVEKNPLDDLSILENKENIKLVIKEGRVEVDRR